MNYTFEERVNEATRLFPNMPESSVCRMETITHLVNKYGFSIRSGYVTQLERSRKNYQKAMSTGRKVDGATSEQHLFLIRQAEDILEHIDGLKSAS